MKKNLFLTVALALASFVGVNAQTWSVTLGSSEGLPGEEVTLDKANVVYYKSGIIRADKPINTMRFTVTSTRNNDKGKDAANNVVWALSELNVYDANDLTKELSYTVKSNADHNTITKSFDGQGLKALYDGSYNNFFHTMWAKDGAVTDYHYVELTFEEPIERFVIEWGGRPSNNSNNPTIVVLTEGGVAAEPYSDRISSFSDEKITDLASLEEAEHFTIRGNAPTSYNTYDNKTGALTSKDGPVEGSGPMYVTLGSTYAAEPTSDYLTQLIPVEDEDTYYIYYPMQNKYLSGDGEQNAFNNAFNGWQEATADINKAAKVTLTPLANGDFEMSYYCEKGSGFDYKDIVYIGADARTGRMKIFSSTNKAALEANGWCQGFGLACAFNWSFCKADYQAPAWAKEYEVGLTYIATKKFHDAIANEEAAVELIEDVESCIADMEAVMKGEVIDINDIKTAVGEAVYNIADEEANTVMTDNWSKWSSNSGEGLKWTRAAYDTYIKPGVDLMTAIEKSENPIEYLEALTEYFKNKEYNTNKFLASENSGNGFPMEFGNLPQAAEQELEVNVDEPVNGFRWTLIENNSGNTNGAGYPFTSFAEMEVINKATGEKVALDAALISSNSNQSGEGKIEGLVDGFKSADGYEGEQYGWYWHAIWGGAAHNPDGEVYLDVKFPAGVELNSFTIKFTGRTGQEHNAPKTVVISEYGKDHAGEEVAIDYNVKIGAQVTDAANLVDGGLYVIQGNLNVNKAEGAAQPRFYAGTRPFGSDKELAAVAPCVYMFKKAGDGWKILSLANGQYWVEEPDYGAENLTIYQGKAGDVQIVKSTNLENAFVIYRDIEPETVKDCSFENEEAGIKIDKMEIVTSKLVYMDWDGGLAARPCYNEMPGVLAPGCEALTDEFKVTSAAGDYLHFNKTNGEGEWNIYEATMDDQYYAYLQGLVEAAEGADLTVGANPGCIAADEATVARFNNAKAAAEVAVNTENKANAEAVVTEYAAAIEVFANSERVGFDPAAVYRIESADKRFLEKTWYTRSVYVNKNALEWIVTPESFENENYEFLFRVSNDPDELEGEEVEVDENEADKTYILQNIGVAKYVGKDFACSNRPAPIVIEPLATCVYNIKSTAGAWHANLHYSGTGYNGNIIGLGGGHPNDPSAWTFIYMGEVADYPLSVEEAVANGDEVVSVSYYTAAGMAISAPVKGINIVVTVYANGVVEAKKVLVK